MKLYRGVEACNPPRFLSVDDTGFDRYMVSTPRRFPKAETSAKFSNPPRTQAVAPYRPQKSWTHFLVDDGGFEPPTPAM